MTQNSLIVKEFAEYTERQIFYLLGGLFGVGVKIDVWQVGYVVPPLLQEALSKDMWRTYEQADWLEMMLRYELEDEIDEPCLWQDLLRAAFGRIDWSEIIENNIE